MTDAEFSWGALGEGWWTASGAELNASTELMKFACARHQGASAAASARLAGITGTAVSIRQAGYRMLRTTTVSNLLSLAAAEDAGTAGGITPVEIDAKLAKMIRSPDSTIAIRAIEAHGKRESTRRAERAVADAEETYPEEDLYNIISCCRTTEAILLCYAEMHLCGNPGKYNRIGIGFGCHSPMMRELVPHLVQRFPEQWKRYRSELVGNVNQMHDFLTELEAGPLLPFEEIAERARVAAVERKQSKAATGGAGASRSGNGQAPPVDTVEVADAAQ